MLVVSLKLVQILSSFKRTAGGCLFSLFYCQDSRFVELCKSGGICLEWSYASFLPSVWRNSLVLRSHLRTLSCSLDISCRCIFELEIERKFALLHIQLARRLAGLRLV